MRRDTSLLTARTFDVLVVGGGIYGLTIACDAAQRGLSVALIERHDFGSGSSFNHLRTIHGGLRYLQTLDIARARQSARERDTLARIAPHAVQPLPFVVPVFPSLTKGKLATRAGLLLDRIVCRSAAGTEPALPRLPRSRLLSMREAVERVPGFRQIESMTGAVVWYDYVTIGADRLTLSWAVAAADHGAVLANYVEATGLVVEDGRVVRAHALDRVARSPLEIDARVVVNATGACVDRLVPALPPARRTPLLKAMNLVTHRPAPSTAVGGRTSFGRHLFLVPWQGRALFGTWESPDACGPDEVEAQRSEVGEFVADINQAFPWVGLRLDDISLVHRGIVPARSGPNGIVRPLGVEVIRDHGSVRGPRGLVSVAGTKYTTARAVAERVTDLLLKKLGKSPEPCRTATTALPDLDHIAGVAELARGHPELAGACAGDGLITGAHLVWAVRHEMAMTLGDVLIRRTPIGALGYPGDAKVSAAAAIVAAELGWDEGRTAAEVAALRRFYVPFI
jgi:glycerol-3-phosphate dehydrogenase